MFSGGREKAHWERVDDHNYFCYSFVEGLIASRYREKEKRPDKQQSVRTSRTNSKCKDQGKFFSIFL